MLPIRAERQPRIQRLLAASVPSAHRESPSPSPSAYPSPPATGRTSTRTSHTPRSPSPHSAHPERPPSKSAPNSAAADSLAPRPVACSKADSPRPSLAPTPGCRHQRHRQSLHHLRSTPRRRTTAARISSKVSCTHPNKTAVRHDYKSLTPDLSRILLALNFKQAPSKYEAPDPKYKANYT